MDAMDPDELPNFQEYAAVPIPGALKSVDKEWGMYAHMSALLGIPLGGLTFAGPLVVWMVRKDSPFAQTEAKEALNFQIGIVVLFLLTLPLAFVTAAYSLILTFAILIYGGVMAVIAGMTAGEGKPYRYPATVRVIQ